MFWIIKSFWRKTAEYNISIHVYTLLRKVRHLTRWNDVTPRSLHNSGFRNRWGHIRNKNDHFPSFHPSETDIRTSPASTGRLISTTRSYPSLEVSPFCPND